MDIIRTQFIHDSIQMCTHIQCSVRCEWRIQDPMRMCVYGLQCNDEIDIKVQLNMLAVVWIISLQRVVALDFTHTHTHILLHESIEKKNTAPCDGKRT